MKRLDKSYKILRDNRFAQRKHVLKGDSRNVKTNISQDAVPSNG